MWNLFDHVGKTIGVSALGPCGTTEMEAVIAPDPRRADLRHEPDPARNTERVLTVLRARNIVLSSGDRDRILAEEDPARLERWLERATVAQSVAEVIDDPS